MLLELNQLNKDKVTAIRSDLGWWRTCTYSKWVNV
ncbi:Trp operon leader peptide [Vibrio sp. ZSDE26]|uniref:Trp operon leader peptide n=1 Tax=Vibrio amylolyticus TaxID=2847292 RepID=A0A9X1XHJ5_9VIBR|nr:Trp operon leader peptide [Vibrio amylolyticus]MCK6261853.1 Trp operon leader peptide [Vibrio amylolyticus]